MQGIKHYETQITKQRTLKKVYNLHFSLATICDGFLQNT